MQLTVETETTIDIEKSMATIEDVPNDKIGTLDVNDMNKKCNGNEEINKVTKDVEDVGHKQNIIEIGEPLSNIPDNNEAELSKVDLSEVLATQNNAETGDELGIESKNKNSASETNGINADKEDIIHEVPDDILDGGDVEDDLEDDIISIQHETVDNIQDQQEETINLDTDKNEACVVNSNLDIDETKSTPVSDSVKKVQEDVIDLIDNSEDCPDKSEDNQELPMQVDNIVEECDKTIIDCDLEPSPVENGVMETSDMAILEMSNKKEDDVISIVDGEDNDELIKEDAKQNNDINILTEETNINGDTEVQTSANVQNDVYAIAVEPTEKKDNEAPEIDEGNDATVKCKETINSSIADEHMDNNVEEENTQKKSNYENMDIELNAPLEKEVNSSLVVVENNEPVARQKITEVNDTIDTTSDKVVSNHESASEDALKENVNEKEAALEEKNVSENEETSKILVTDDQEECLKQDSCNTQDVLSEEIHLQDTTVFKEDCSKQENHIEKEMKCDSKANAIIVEGVKENNVEDKVVSQSTSKDEDVAILEPEVRQLPDKDSKKSESEVECMEIEDSTMSHTVNTTECEPAIELSNSDAVDSAVVLTEDTTTIDKEMEVAKIATEVESSALKESIDVEPVLEETKSKEVSSEVLSTTVKNTSVKNVIERPVICKLSNTLDILSDDDEELSIAETPTKEHPKTELPKETEDPTNKCINLEDDDDIMLVDEVDTAKVKTTAPDDNKAAEEVPVKDDAKTESVTDDRTTKEATDQNAPPVLVSSDTDDKKGVTSPSITENTNKEIDIKEKAPENIVEATAPKPLVPENCLKTAKKKLCDMTREELEEFCVLKVVESIVDRSSLSALKSKLKNLTQNLDECRKKTLTVTKQNRDLQVVLKSVQEEQKKAGANTTITPLKITRSVGMQVIMEKTIVRKKPQQPNNTNKNTNMPQNNANANKANVRYYKQNPQNIPVPRLVPANNPGIKTAGTTPVINQTNTPNKNNNQPNGIIKTPTPVMKAEKRQHNKIVSPSTSVTVDLTDDEPPTKLPGGARSSPAPPVRLVPPQNLMAPQRQPFGPNVNSPRKVYIPISGPQSQALRPGQTIMLKSVPASGMRPRCPTSQGPRLEQSGPRMNRQPLRHPAPLPAAMKQYQPPNWKGLPPPPDLKLSKVDNGIVISWKIEGIPEDSYEEIASYQLYAYQETTTPPNTSLWKKIGDVKALPLPMACTLTQFMAGFKYFFAVRAVDIRSRLGPFSLPASILLLNKS